MSLSDPIHNLLGCLYAFPYHHQLCISYPHLCFGPPITLRLPPLSFGGFCFLLFASSVRSSTSSCLYPGSALTKVASSCHLPNLVFGTHCSRVGSCLRDCMIASHPWSSGSIPPPRSSHTDSETKISFWNQNHFDVHCSPFPAARSKSKSSSFASTTMGWPGLSLNLIRPELCL